MAPQQVSQWRRLLPLTRRCIVPSWPRTTPPAGAGTRRRSMRRCRADSMTNTRGA